MGSSLGLEDPLEQEMTSQLVSIIIIMDSPLKTERRCSISGDQQRSLYVTQNIFEEFEQKLKVCQTNTNFKEQGQEKLKLFLGQEELSLAKKCYNQQKGLFFILLFGTTRRKPKSCCLDRLMLIRDRQAAKIYSSSVSFHLKQNGYQTRKNHTGIDKRGLKP